MRCYGIQSEEQRSIMSTSCFLSCLLEVAVTGTEVLLATAKKGSLFKVAEVLYVLEEREGTLLMAVVLTETAEGRVGRDGQDGKLSSLSSSLLSLMSL